MKQQQNLWLIPVVVLALALGAFFLHSRRAQTPPPATSSPAATGSAAAAGGAGRLQTRDLAQVAASARPAVPQLDQLREPLQLRPEQLARLRRESPGTLRPELLRGGRSSAGWVEPNLSPVDITGSEPLPPGTQLTPQTDPAGRFSFELPAGWQLSPTPLLPGAVMTAAPAGDTSGKVLAAIYASRLPPAELEPIRRKLLEAVTLRGEQLISTRSIQDGSSTGLEVVTRATPASGPPIRQRAHYLRAGNVLLQLQGRAPESEFDRHSPAFRAMARSLRPGPQG